MNRYVTQILRSAIRGYFFNSYMDEKKKKNKDKEKQTNKSKNKHTHGQ